MKNYDPNIWDGIHTVRVTIQLWEYIGHIFKRVGGNCRGRDILDFDFEYEDADLENDCQLSFDEKYELFSAVLKNENGDIMEIEEDAQFFNNMIVAIEIIDHKMRETEQHERK